MDVLVLVAGVFEVTAQSAGYSFNIVVPKPQYGSFTLLDSTGENLFQINASGIFQNAASINPGTYIVYAAYTRLIE